MDFMQLHGLRCPKTSVVFLAKNAAQRDFEKQEKKATIVAARACLEYTKKRMRAMKNARIHDVFIKRET